MTAVTVAGQAREVRELIARHLAEPEFWTQMETTDAIELWLACGSPVLRPFVTLETALLINDRGEIVARGTDSRAVGLENYFLEPVRGQR